MPKLYKFDHSSGFSSATPEFAAGIFMSHAPEGPRVHTNNQPTMKQCAALMPYYFQENGDYRTITRYVGGGGDWGQLGVMVYGSEGGNATTQNYFSISDTRKVILTRVGFADYYNGRSVDFSTGFQKNVNGNWIDVTATPIDAATAPGNLMLTRVDNTNVRLTGYVMHAKEWPFRLRVYSSVRGWYFIDFSAGGSIAPTGYYNCRASYDPRPDMAGHPSYISSCGPGLYLIKDIDILIPCEIGEKIRVLGDMPNSGGDPFTTFVYKAFWPTIDVAQADGGSNIYTHVGLFNSFSTRNSSIRYGKPVELLYSSSEPVMVGGNTYPANNDGVITLYPDRTTTYTAVSGGTTKTATVNVVALASVSTDRTAIVEGDHVTLSWDSDGMPVNINGTQYNGASAMFTPTTTTRYDVSCGADTRSVTVDVTGIKQLIVDKPVITFTDTATITWDTENADYVKLNANPVPDTGSITVAPRKDGVHEYVLEVGKVGVGSVTKILPVTYVCSNCCGDKADTT
jgi:hypothetical protein